MKTISAILVLFFIATTTAAKVRPTIPKLFLSNAGLKPVKEEALLSFSNITICTDDYPQGFTIRCDTITGPDYKRVEFRTSGKMYMKEVISPYYLQGDTMRRVQAFKFDLFEEKKRLRVSCRVRTRRAVWVDIFRGCEEAETETETTSS